MSYITLLVLAEIALGLLSYRLLKPYLVYIRIFNKLRLADARYVPQYVWNILLTTSLAWCSVIALYIL